MKKHIKYLLIGSLIALPAFSAMAEDDSCELKKGDHKSASSNSTNEFTKDKTWRFKIDNNLPNDNPDQNRSSKLESTTKTTSDIVKI